MAKDNVTRTVRVSARAEPAKKPSTKRQDVRKRHAHDATTGCSGPVRASRGNMEMDGMAMKWRSRPRLEPDVSCHSADRHLLAAARPALDLWQPNRALLIGAHCTTPE